MEEYTSMEKSVKPPRPTKLWSHLCGGRVLEYLWVTPCPHCGKERKKEDDSPKV